MAKVSVSRNAELIHKLFGILTKHPDGLTPRDALVKLASEVTLTDHESGQYPSGGQRFDKNVRFATLGPTKAGWLYKTEGKWFVTDEGRKAFAKYPDAGSFYKESTVLYQKWSKLNKPADDASDSDNSEVAPASKSTTVTFEMAEEQAWQEIEAHLLNMPPYEFQDMVAALLKGMNYHVSWIAPPGKDGGQDIIAWSDPLGTRPPRIKVQVKREQKKIPVESVRSFLSLLGDNDVGIFVSAGGFTPDAETTSRNQENRRITLIDMRRLVDLWIENYAKIDEASRRKFPLQAIWFLAPEE